MPSPAATRPLFLGYQRLRRVAVALLVVEVVVGMGGYLTPGKEIFPFASWFLFLLVPNRTTAYDLILRAQNSQPIEPPQPYAQLAWLVYGAHSVVTYQLVQQLGEADHRHDAAAVHSLRRQIEAQFAQPGMQYDLVRNTYRPVERWKSGQVIERQTLRSLTIG